MRLGGESVGDGRRERLRLIAIAVLVVAGFIAFQRLLPSLDIEGFLEDLARGLGDWTYALVGLLAFLETGAFVGLIFPGETAVILGGALAGQGETSVVLMLAIVWFCAWAGDTVSFWIGRELGRDFVLRHGPRVRITHERFAQVEDYFARHGGKTILIGRFLGLVRALAPFIAGSSGMRYRLFLPISILGTGLWAATFTLLGYFISESLNEATEVAGQGTFVFGTLVFVAVGAVIAFRFLRVAENRARAVAAIERRRALRPLLALARRLRPQLTFIGQRLTPGGTLGLEFTSLLAALAVALFVLVGYAIEVSAAPGPTPGDSEAFDIVRELRSAWLTDVAELVTVLGSTAFTLAATAVAAAVLAWRRRWPELVVLVAAIVLVHVAVPVLKEVVDRPRPPDGLVEADGGSYPSGHATYSVLYTWLVLTVTVRLRPGLAHSAALLAAGVAVTAAVGLTRVYLGVHYLSDISGGWALGVATFAGCAAVAMVVTRLRQNPRG